MSAIAEIAQERPRRHELLALYRSAGWDAYTQDPAALEAAIDGSTFVVTARAEGELVGLARAISDGVSIAYVQDLLVAPGSRRSGVGSALLAAVLARFAHVRQLVLLSDAEPRADAFYRSLGLTQVSESAGLRAFVRSPAPPGDDHVRE